MTSACTLHKRHPLVMPLTVEQHHVIPVAWQQFAFSAPIVPPPDAIPGNDQDGRGHLWDARTVACCPTGHRNVHAWIVLIMKTFDGIAKRLAAQATVAADSSVLATAISALNRRRPAPEFATACLAPQRILASNGSLSALIAGNEWGYA